jgi:hypothetical protein
MRSWICDACGREIAKADHGMFEWVPVNRAGGQLHYGPPRAERLKEGLRLVHRDGIEGKTLNSRSCMQSGPELSSIKLGGNVVGVDGNITVSGLKCLLTLGRIGGEVQPGQVVAMALRLIE